MQEKHEHAASGEDAVGSLADEAAKLLGAAVDWARDSGAGHAETSGGSHEADCTWCPLCRGVALVREISPEVRAHLTAAAGSLLQAAASALATTVPDDARRSGVEHIDLDDTDDPDDTDDHDPSGGTP